MNDPTFRDRRSGGFTLTELLVVVGIIAVMAAVSLPMISSYLKTYTIKGATQKVAGEIQAARMKAISKNVNLGVVFVTLDTTHYRWVVEDNQIAAGGISSFNFRRPLAAILGDTPANVAAQAGPLNELPVGLTFTQTCPGGVPTGGSWEAGFRFNRLGAWCSPGTSGCPDLDVGQAFVYNAPNSGTSGNESAGAVLCIVQAQTGLARRVFVRPGGRVVVQQ